MTLSRITQINLGSLGMNPYPGRGLVVGRSDDGASLVQVYWIMGRSSNSRNRRFSKAGIRVFTEAVDAALVSDPSLIMYNAMNEAKGVYVVSNGHQTSSMLGISREGYMENALESWNYEPDGPNFTPRISGYCSTDTRTPVAGLAILRKSLWGESCDRAFYYYKEIAAGFGFCLTTYSSDGDPLPSFRGDPLLMPLHGTLKQVAETYWQKLDESNKVALAVKFIPVAGGESTLHIINKY